MKQLILPNDTLTNKISFCHLALFLMALPFDQFYSELLLISLAIHTLIHVRKDDFKKLWQKEMLILSSVFLLTLIGTLYTQNKQEAFKLLSRQSAIAILPVVVSLNRIDLRKYLRPMLMCFAASCVIVIAYLYIDAVRIIRFNHLPVSSLVSPSFLNHNFSEPIGIHATYLSMYVSIAIVTLIHFFPKKKTVYKLAVASSTLLLLAGLVQLGSRSILAATLAILCLVLPFYSNRTNKHVLLRISFIGLFFITVAVAVIPSLRYRFINELRADLSDKKEAYSIADSRLKRWELTLELIKKSPLVGYGSGDEVDLLRSRYFQQRLYDSYLNKLNTHNQYLSFLLSGGLVALAIYLGTLIYCLRLAIKHRNVIFLCFLIVIATVSLSENILSRNKGIFFYSFFTTVFSLSGATVRRRLQQPKSIATPGNPAQRLTVYISTI